VIPKNEGELLVALGSMLSSLHKKLWCYYCTHGYA